MKVCRRQGVRSMEIEGFKFTLENDVPQRLRNNGSAKAGATSAGIITDDTTIQTPDMPSIDQLIDWSAGANGIPSSVPQPNENNS